MRLPLRLIALALVVTGCRPAEPPRANSAVILETAIPTPPRKGVEPRPDYLKDAPVNGLLLKSNGLVNETYHITVDFDSRLLTSVKKFASHQIEEKHTRTLTKDEIDSLRADRERVWSTWEAPPPNPAAEYHEVLFLLDGGESTDITAQGGFHEANSGNAPDTLALVKRLEELR